jgi:LPXTG-site transpeptidase (sortase) family protein
MKFNKYRITTFGIAIITMCGLITYSYHIQKTNNVDVKSIEVINQEFNGFIAEDNNNIIANLKCDKIRLNAPIKEGVDMLTLEEYLGHFPETSMIDGNIAICGHTDTANLGIDYYFNRLNELVPGDVVTYYNDYWNMDYEVAEVKEVYEYDLSVLSPTGDNRLTLITCTGNPLTRLCIICRRVEHNI